MSRKSLLSLLVGTAFSAIGLYLAFQNIPISSLMAYATKVNYWWMLPAAVSLGLAYWIRSIRWQWLLLSTGRPRLSSAYHSLVISMMINCLLPGRIGELARPIVLKRIEGIPLPSSMAALGVERLLDLSALLIMFVPTLMILKPTADAAVNFGGQLLNRNLLLNLGYISLSIAFCLVLVIIAMGNDRMRHRVVAWISRLPEFFDKIGMEKLKMTFLQNTPRAIDLIERAALGVKTICHWKGFMLAFLSSLIFWIFNAFSFYFLSIGSPGIDLVFYDICSVMVIICFFIALPSVPGFWGLWEAAGVFGLSLYGINHETAAGYALFSHAFNILPVIAAGWLSCLALGLKWKTVTHRTPRSRLDDELTRSSVA